MKPDYAKFSTKVELLAKECGLELKDHSEVIIHPTFTTEGYIGEWSCLYVRPTTQETQTC